MSTETDEESANADASEADDFDDTDTGDVSSTSSTDSDTNSGNDSDTTSATDSDCTDDTGPTQHARAIIVTTSATLLGILAGLVSTFMATEAGEPNSTFGFAILLAAVIVQFPLYRLFGMDSDSFETKDQLYIFAMTFIMWFVTWSIVLTTGALQ